MVDRLLLVLLVLLLPLGIFGSKEIVKRWQGESNDPQSEYLQEVEALLIQLVDRNKSGGTQVNQAPPLEILSVSAATSSGVVSVYGQSPKPHYGVTVSATVLPVLDDGNEVLGGAVSLSSLRPKADGSFRYEYLIPSGKNGILELTFRSGESFAVVQIDLETNEVIEEE